MPVFMLALAGGIAAISKYSAKDRGEDDGDSTSTTDDAGHDDVDWADVEDADTSWPAPSTLTDSIIEGENATGSKGLQAGRRPTLTDSFTEDENASGSKGSLASSSAADATPSEVVTVLLEQLHYPYYGHDNCGKGEHEAVEASETPEDKGQPPQPSCDVPTLLDSRPPSVRLEPIAEVDAEAMIDAEAEAVADTFFESMADTSSCSLTMPSLGSNSSLEQFEAAAEGPASAHDDKVDYAAEVSCSLAMPSLSMPSLGSPKPSSPLPRRPLSTEGAARRSHDDASWIVVDDCVEAEDARPQDFGGFVVVRSDATVSSPHAADYRRAASFTSSAALAKRR